MEEVQEADRADLKGEVAGDWGGEMLTICR